jgi:ketosteroid isomerase-like protein
MHEIATRAYQRWSAGDIDGLLDLFVDDAQFIVPGSTTISGEHDKEGFRDVLEHVGELSIAGQHRQELVCSYEGPSGAVWVFDNAVAVDGQELEYHSVHEWVVRHGELHAWMLYVHEYDRFEEAWS